MLPALNTPPSTFISKVRLCCILGSCIGLAFLSDFASEPGLEPVSKLETKPAYTAEGNLKDDSVGSDDELAPEDLPDLSDPLNGQVPSVMPSNMRTIILCCLLLCVALSNIKVLFEPCVLLDNERKKKEASHSSGIMDFGGNFARVVKRMVSRSVVTSPFFLYGMFVLFVIGMYIYLFKLLEAKKYKMLPTDWCLFVSAGAEGFGILSLRHKIRSSGHAQGVSAKSVALFAMLYLDTACNLPVLSSQQLDIWACKVLEWVSLFLVVDVLRSILTTHRKTYQKELDVVPVKTLVAVCAVAALVYQPSRANKDSTGIGFTFRIFVDTFALVPQVVMMSLQDQPVQAPIAHFVAINSVSRMIDLSFWMREFKFFSGPLAMSSSGWVICLLHVACLLVVADFFYYYVKTWIAGRGFNEDVPIPSAMDV